MKRHFRNIMLLLLALALAGGCAPATHAPTITLATATTGGVWHPLGLALSALIGRHVPGVTAVAQATGGAIENLKLLAAGKVNMALVYDYHVAWLNAGQMPAVSAKPLPARIILGLYEHPLHIVTRADAGIAGVGDLKGKRVSTGAADSGAEEQARFVFGALGLNWDTDIARQKLSVADSAAALKAGKIDAFFWSGALPSETAPTAALDGLANDATVQMTLLPLQGDLAERIINANPGVFHRTVIRRGEYAGLDADVETLAVTAALATLDSFPDDRLTAVLHAVFDHKAELSAVWKGAARLTPEVSVAMLAPAARPYVHPAAAALLQTRETLYQISSMKALRAGQFESFSNVGWLKQQGNLGMGTFEGLDGEMILLDGVVYQVKGNGVVAPAGDSVGVPYAMATCFDADTVTADLGALPNLAALYAALDQWIVRKDAFYAIRVDGVFQQVRVRSVPKQPTPYPELTKALEQQNVFEYQNIEGSAIGFWCPEEVGGFNQAGYHLHFISADRTRGGHLLEVALAQGRAALDETRAFDMRLRPVGP